MRLGLKHDEWNEWLEAKGLSPRTILEYNSYLKRFDFDKFSQQGIIKFIDAHNNIVARAFIKNLLHYVQTSYGADVKVFVKDIEIPKVTGRKKKRILEVITRDEVHKIGDALSSERNKLMLFITFYCGLRVSELVGIKPYDFNWTTWISEPTKQGRLKVLGKGNQQDIVFVPQWLMARVYQWVKNKVSKKQSKNDPLFKIGWRRWREILYNASFEAIGRKIHPHLLRHSIGTWLGDNNWDVKDIAVFLRHKSVVTTQIYKQVSKERITNKYNEFLMKEDR